MILGLGGFIVWVFFMFVGFVFKVFCGGCVMVVELVFCFGMDWEVGDVLYYDDCVVVGFVWCCCC